jgi:hypothetical protein
VVTLGNKLIVITQNGDVFGHDVSGRDIGQPFRFSGSKAAFNHDQDRFVVTIGNKLIVTTQNGDVFGHDVSGRDIGQPFKFTGSKMAFNPQDRFVVTLGDTMIVTTKNGDAFGADVSGRDIGPIFQLNPLDALRLRLVDRIFEIEAIGDGFELNSGVNVHHQFQTLGFDGVSHHAFGDTDTTTDGDGHFDGMTFSIPSNTFNIEASAVDVATGRTTIATVLRPQVR